MFSRKAQALMKATQRSSTKSNTTNSLARMHSSKVRKDTVVRACSLGAAQCVMSNGAAKLILVDLVGGEEDDDGT